MLYDIRSLALISTALISWEIGTPSNWYRDCPWAMADFAISFNLRELPCRRLFTEPDRDDQHPGGIPFVKSIHGIAFHSWISCGCRSRGPIVQ